MRTYEGVFIFQQTVDDEAMNKRLDKINSEITGLGGTVSSAIPMGRKTFARPMKKKESGVFVLIPFAMEPDRIKSLTERLKLNKDILRVQIVLANKTSAQIQPTAKARKQVGERVKGL